MATILTKKSDTASAVPLAADLTNAAGGAELAVNATDKRLFSKTSGGTVVELGTNPSTLVLPSGSANGVAYLNGSKVVTSGSALTFNGTSLGIGSSSYGDAGSITASIGVAGTTAGGLQLWASSAQEHYIQWGDSTTGSATYAGAISYSHASDFMRFWTNSTEQMRLTSTGLGIGTSSPAYKVNAVVPSATDAFFADANNLAYSGYRIRAGVSGQQWAFRGGTSTMGLTDVTAGVDRVVVDTSGNLGLGVTPSAGLATANYRLFEIGLDGGGSIYSGTNQTLIGTNIAWAGGTPNYKRTGSAPTLYNQQNGSHSWSTAPSGTAGNAITFTQAATLDANGNFLVGTTSASNSGIGSGFQVQNLSGNGTTINIGHPSSASDGYSYALFSYNNGIIGSIGQSGTTAVAYNTSSDYRLKNITGPVTTSGAYIDNLNPVEGTWKADGSIFVGLIAHEVQEASRTKVATGTKDGAEMQAMDYSNSELIANLIAEIKSLRQRVATLEAK